MLSPVCSICLMLSILMTRPWVNSSSTVTCYMVDSECGIGLKQTVIIVKCFQITLCGLINGCIFITAGRNLK